MSKFPCCSARVVRVSCGTDCLASCREVRSAGPLTVFTTDSLSSFPFTCVRVPCAATAFVSRVCILQPLASGCMELVLLFPYVVSWRMCAVSTSPVWSLVVLPAVVVMAMLCRSATCPVTTACAVKCVFVR